MGCIFQTSSHAAGLCARVLFEVVLVVLVAAVVVVVAVAVALA
jgi:hypothetical protein